MAASSTSDIKSYTLREFVESFELPKSIRVTKGQKARNENTATIKKGQFFLLERVSSVLYLSGVTSDGGHKVSIPVDYQQKVEILSSCSVDEPVQTVEELLERSSLHDDVNYIRVVNEHRFSDEQVLRTGEILKLVSVDQEGKSLMAIDNEGCQYNFPVDHCSATFHLLDSYREVYSLADVLDKDLLPTRVRFVDVLSPEVRRTFIEENGSYRSFGVIYLEKTTCEKRGVEATFGDAQDWTRVFWLPIDLDIMVTEIDARSEDDTEPQADEINAEGPYEKWVVNPGNGQTSVIYDNDDDDDDDDGCTRGDGGADTELTPEKFKSGTMARLSARFKMKRFSNTLSLPNLWRKRQTAQERNRKESDASERETNSLKTSQRKLSDPLPNIPHGHFHSDVLKSFPPNDESVSPSDRLATDVIVYERMDGTARPAVDLIPIPPSSFTSDSLSHIPSDLSTLSESDVISLLERMNLGRYAKEFELEQVDGSLLTMLDQDMLVSRFGFDKFHAMKLSKFVSGWRPSDSAK